MQPITRDVDGYFPLRFLPTTISKTRLTMGHHCHMQLEQFRYARRGAVEKMSHQRPTPYELRTHQKVEGSGFSLRQGHVEIEGIRYEPSLEELIEACPTNIGKATFVLGSANQGQEWVACYFDFVTNRGSDFNETGSTPVEAVAKLWLALHAAGC
jgi:hypothetical protein